MLSAGMFSALAAAMALRRRGLPSGSPPPERAAMVISLMRRVKILPRLASSAPFLCLIVAHFEWPDITNLGALSGEFLRRNAGKQTCFRAIAATTKYSRGGADFALTRVA